MKSFALRSAALHFQSVSLPIWHPSSLPHGNRNARGGQIKPREKKRELERETERVCEADSRLKDNILGIPLCWEHPPPPPPPPPSSCSSCSSSSSSALAAALCFREEMASPAPRGPSDLLGRTSKPVWLQHPDTVPPVHWACTAEQYDNREHACERGGVWFALCVSTCTWLSEHLLCLDSRAAGPTAFCVSLPMYTSYLQRVCDVWGYFWTITPSLHEMDTTSHVCLLNMKLPPGDISLA